MIQQRNLSHTQRGQGRMVSVMGELVIFKLTGADTGGSIAMVEQVTQPGGGASFLHSHSPSESFYVLEGEYEYYGQNEDGKYAIRCSAGDLIHIPGGAAHGFKNVGDHPGRLFVTFEPAGVMEVFFEEIGVPVTNPTKLPAATPPDPAVIGPLFQKYGIQILEPPR